MPVEDNEPQDDYDDCQRYTAYVQEQVITNYVHDYWPKKHQTKRHKPIHQQQRTTHHLQPCNNPKVVRQSECADKLSCQSCRHWAHVEEIQKTIQPKHNGDQPE